MNISLQKYLPFLGKPHATELLSPASSTEILETKLDLLQEGDIALPPDSYVWVCSPPAIPETPAKIFAPSVTAAYKDAFKQVSQNGLRLEHLGNFASSSHIVQRALRQNGLALAFADPDLCTNRAIVMTAVQNNGAALRYAHPELRADIKVALAAVASNGLALEFVAPALRSLRLEISQIAVRNSAHAIAFVPPEQQNHPYILTAIRKSLSSNCKIKLMNDDELIVYIQERFLQKTK